MELKNLQKKISNVLMSVQVNLSCNVPLLNNQWGGNGVYRWLEECLNVLETGLTDMMVTSSINT